MTSTFFSSFRQEQAALDFPVPLSEKYRPKTISEFVGLKRVTRVLNAFATRPCPAAWFFCGAPGTGKTAMALALAGAVNGEIHHIPSRHCDLETVDDVCRLCWYAPLSGGWHIVIVDEADQMSRPAQLSFLSKLDATAFPPQTIFVFTANSKAGLEPRFLSRCRVLEFAPDESDSPVWFLRMVWDSETDNAPAPDLKAIVKETGSNLREALMRLEIELLAA